MPVKLGKLPWQNHTHQILSKLSAAYYAVMIKFHVSNTDTLQMIHFVFFHSVIKYEMIVGENLQTGYLHYEKGNLK
jgi:hypothetical protein